MAANITKVDIPVFSASATASQVTAAVREVGCAIVRELAEREVVDRIQAELAPYFDAAPMSDGSFMGRHTQRTCRIVVKAPSSHALILNQLVLDVVGAILEGSAYHFDLHHTEAGRMHPGEPAQSLHRDDGPYPFKHPCKPIRMTVIWALTRFTAANGATRVVPGSHVWDDVRRATEAEVQLSEMPPGSVLLYDSALHHGAGANQTADEIRGSLTFAYGLGWLRAFENPTLAVPPEIARTLPQKLQELLQYRNHGFLGHYEMRNPKIVLSDDVPDVLAASDLYDEFEGLQLVRR
jgi:ectoine hydroxylase-related dioxygenase (phytanoyl-CoA dioxygenase family)